MAKPGDKGCKLHLKALEEKEGIQEVTTSLAAAREINEDAGFIRTDVCAILLTSFSKSLVKNWGASQPARGQ